MKQKNNMKQYRVYISYTTYVSKVYTAESEEDALDMCREDSDLTNEAVMNLQENDWEVEELV